MLHGLTERIIGEQTDKANFLGGWSKVVENQTDFMWQSAGWGSLT